MILRVGAMIYEISWPCLLTRKEGWDTYANRLIRPAEIWESGTRRVRRARPYRRRRVLLGRQARDAARSHQGRGRVARHPGLSIALAQDCACARDFARARG